MATRIQSSPSPLSWQRIVALSSTFVLHVAAVAVVAIPIAAPLVRTPPDVVPTVVFDDHPPPVALPEPPGPVPPKHILPTHKTTAPPPVATSAPVATNTVAIDSPMAIPASTGEPAAGISSGTSDAPSGETRTLAYDGALKLRYPPMSMRQREQGTVLLRVLVDASGGVQRIEIERSSGHAQLDAAAREAVQRARFKPVLRDGQAIPAWGIVPIEFRLDRA
ncbi:MAG: energy transducer TonB [Dokdonella sp.]